MKHDIKTNRRTFLAGAVGTGAAGIAATTGWRRYTSAALQDAPPVAEGYALVTSPRVPLFGVGETYARSDMSGVYRGQKEIQAVAKNAAPPSALRPLRPAFARRDVKLCAEWTL